MPIGKYRALTRAPGDWISEINDTGDLTGGSKGMSLTPEILIDYPVKKALKAAYVKIDENSEPIFIYLGRVYINGQGHQERLEQVLYDFIATKPKILGVIFETQLFFQDPPHVVGFFNSQTVRTHTSLRTPIYENLILSNDIVDVALRERLFPL